jgi:uncharacterized protein
MVLGPMSRVNFAPRSRGRDHLDSPPMERGPSGVDARGSSGESAAPVGDLLELLDWKRRVFDLYRHVRGAAEPEVAWRDWRAGRDELLARHAQSPLDERGRAGFRGLEYFDYDPAARVLATVAPVEPATLELPTSGAEPYRFTHAGDAVLRLGGRDLRLALYWLQGYGGGPYLPFADATSGREAYGAGRYVLDTVKGADLGMDGDRLVLDFNFAYNPSCAYDPRWLCPLAPPQNRLPIEVRAGERYPQGRYVA